MAALSLLQSGTKTLAAASASMTIVRGVDAGFDSTVDPAKTILLVTTRTSANEIRDALPGWELTDGDTITVTRASTTGAVLVNWRLLSFSSGVTVQRRQIALGVSATTGTAAITAVNLSKTFVLSGGIPASSGGANEARQWGRWKLDNSTTVRVTRNLADGSFTATYNCQIVEYDACTVQVVEQTLSATTALTDDRTITAVNQTKTAIFGTMFTDAGGAVPRDSHWSARLTSDTNLRLERSNGTSHTFNYTVYVVEFTDATEVRSHAVSIADAVSTANVTISSVDLTRSVSMVCGISPVGSSSGRTAVSTAALSRHMASSLLSTATNHQVQRATSNEQQNYDGQVIQFAVDPTITVGGELWSQTMIVSGPSTTVAVFS